MEHALVNGKMSEVTEETRKLQAICPYCHDKVIAKTGEIRVWHWAHLSDGECMGGENETDWHRDWKKFVPIEWREKTVRIGEKFKRADILKPTCFPVAYEFQHSPIGVKEIWNRENFYLKEVKCGLVWVFDLTERSENISLRSMESGIREDIILGEVVSFYWMSGSISMLYTTTQLYLDLGEYLLSPKNILSECMLRVQTVSTPKEDGKQKFSGTARVINKQIFLAEELLFYLPYQEECYNEIFPEHKAILDYEN